MHIRAENDPRYSRKFLIMGGFLIFGALWFLKDAVFGYPALEAKGFEDYKSEMMQSQRSSMFSGGAHQAITLAEFMVVADERELAGWTDYAQHREIPTGAKIVEQYVFAALCGVLGLGFLSIPLRSRGRWIEASDDGITSSWGESFRFDEVEVVNKRTWRKKGIAKVTYVSGGRRRTFVIDDFKFQRWQTDAILYELEQRIDEGRIINGPPESEPEDEVAEILAASRSSGPPVPA
jgi:hypothetical protein